MGKSLIYFIVLVIFATFQYEVDARSALQIVNGTAATDGEFPYMVELSDSNGYFVCGGSIIAAEWILTAGHCVFDGIIHSIVYGTNKLYDGENPVPDTRIIVKKWYLHPNWTDNNDTTVPIYDVALLHLDKPIPLNKKAEPLKLANANEKVPFHVHGVLSGWGYNKTGAPHPMPTLQKIHLKLQKDDECTKQINGYSKDDSFNSTLMLCTNNHLSGQCSGDSGSPFVVNGTQFGIVSWSFKPCGITPGVFARVTNPIHREWIKKISKI